MRRHNGPFLGNLWPGNRYYPSTLFERKSQRKRTLVAQPVILDPVMRLAPPVSPSQLGPSQRLRFYQKEFSLTQFAERDEAGWIGAFVKHGIPPKGCSSEPERAFPMHADHHTVTDLKSQEPV